MRMLTSYIVVMCALMGQVDLSFAGGTTRPVFCQESLVLKAPGFAAQTIREISSALRIPLPLREPHSLLDWMGIFPEFSQEIVIFSMNNFLGDTMIVHCSLLDFIRERYPRAKIKFIGPKVEILGRSQDPQLSLLSFPVKFTEYVKQQDRVQKIHAFSAQINKVVRENILPGSLVLFDWTTLKKADEELVAAGIGENERPSFLMLKALHSNRSFGVGIGQIQEGRIRPGITGMALVPPDGKFKVQLSSSPPVEVYRQAGEGDFGYAFNFSKLSNDDTIYESSLKIAALTFGDEVFLRWRTADYITEQDSTKLKSYLNSSFEHPEQPLALINLNTFGRSKVRELTPLYFDLLMNTIQHSLSRAARLNLFVTFPEPQFGAELQLKLLEALAPLKSRVHLLPASRRELIPAVIEASKFVVSYDSGLVHLAAFAPQEKVLSISFSEGGASLWRKPGQAAIHMVGKPDVDEMSLRIAKWMDSQVP